MGDRTPYPRRTILSTLGAATLGTTVQAHSNEHDPQRRPYTETVRGLTCTYHDCSRVTLDVDGPHCIERLRMHGRYHSTSVPTEETEFEFENPTFPFEFVANCHLNAVDDQTHGSIVLSDVEAILSCGEDIEFGQPVSWNCHAVMSQDVEPEIIEEYCRD